MDDRHPVDVLAEEFADRIRAGENPQIEEYANQYPDHADLIRSVFPSIAMVERVSNRTEQPPKNGFGRAVVFNTHGVPESLGDFRLVREIGRGGMGVVYEAIQLSLKRHVALKVIGAVPSGSDKQQERFRREAEAAACLHHTHIVPVYGIGEDQGVQYYAMQLIDGVTLGEVIRFLHGDRPNREVSAKTTASRATFSTQEAAQLLLDNRTAKSESSLPSPVHGVPKSGEEATLVLDLKTTSPTDAAVAVADAASVGMDAGSIHHVASVGTDAGSISYDASVGVDAGSIHHDASVGMDAGSIHHVRQFSQAYYRNVARIVSHVADGLQYAHHQGVLHRDIKPGNLLLDRDGIVWITDFGLARRTDCEGMTQTGEIVGTLRYMAPEQMRGQADQRTDIFSLGLTLFELLTLQPAIEQPQSRLYQTGTIETVARMHSLYPAIPSDLQTITLKACAVEASHRYQTAAEFEEDLRRFLEDRPILARRTTSVEKLFRWARRNPTVAALSSATFVLLLTVAGLLAVFNQRKQMALDAISKEFEEKTAALATVERERARAELNLDLAVQAFDTVVANIAARGSTNSILSDLGDDGEMITLADATLSDADVVLLETLLGFFDRFSAENAKDLSGKSAAARQRVGDIQHRLGRLDDAERSYLLALEAFKSNAARNLDDHELVFIQANILNDLLVIAAKRGQMPIAMERFQEARNLLEQSEAIRNSTEGRFALAKTLNNLAAIGSKFNREPRPRPPGPFGNRFVKPFEDSMASMQKARLQREAEANGEALQLLKDLTSEAPDTIAYRIALAQALRDEVRIARIVNDWNRADESLSKAIAIFEKLGEEFPESDVFKYELVVTLSISVTTRPNEMPRFMRAMKLCDQLIESHPNVAEYRTLRGQTLVKLSTLQFSAGRKDRAEDSLRQAIEIQQKLADQYPDVLLYQFNLVRSIQQLAEFHLEIKRPDLARQDLALALTRLERFQGQNRLMGAIQPQIVQLRKRLKSLE